MNVKAFSRIGLTQTFLLPIQFLMGMWINLFINIPDPIVRAFFASGKSVIIILHIINGLAIISLAVVIIVFSVKMKATAVLQFASVAAGFALLAIASGVTFLFFGQIDAFSYTMAVGFVTAAVLYSFMGRAALLAAVKK